jgi:hypothetical protein
MKHATLLILAALAGMGCIQGQGFLAVESTPVPSQVAKPEVTRPAPVSADQITAENAQEKIKSLSLEVERDENGDVRIEAAAQNKKR